MRKRQTKLFVRVVQTVLACRSAPFPPPRDVLSLPIEWAQYYSPIHRVVFREPTQKEIELLKVLLQVYNFLKERSNWVALGLETTIPIYYASNLVNCTQVARGI